MFRQTHPHADEQMREYARWHRELCQVNDWLFLSGDLHPKADKAFAQLESWEKAGITDIMDVRLEWSDKDYVKEVAPDFRYHYLPTDDAGQKQQDSWFDEALEVARRVRQDGGKLVVHCHLCVNRAPSLALRLLLDEGMNPIDGMDHILSRRPVVGIVYAHDAVRHWAKGGGQTEQEIAQWMEQVSEWFKRNKVDLGTIIRAMRTGENYR